jgi:short-subunit dehydrogenase
MSGTKTILITGASSGLGAGMAREFASKGYDLALCARRTERLEALRSELQQKHGVRVELRALDVNDHDQVFSVFEDFARVFSRLDRIVVNAGVGEGRRIGTGHFDTNRRTVETNFVAGLAQCEAAVGIFRKQMSGHLVIISSMSALRGLPKHLTAYGASKAGIAHLGEGIRSELLDTPIQVTTVFPGYIRTELNDKASHMPFEVDAETGCRAIVRAIERAPAKAYVPAWPWAGMSLVMRMLPLRLVRKLG